MKSRREAVIGILLLVLPALGAARGEDGMKEAASSLARVSHELRQAVEAPEGPWCASADAATLRMLRSEVQGLDSMAGRFRHHLDMGQTTDPEARRALERMNRHVGSIRDQLVGFSYPEIDGAYRRASHLLRGLNRSYYREPDIFRQQPGGRWLDHPLDQARISERGFGFPGGLRGCGVCGRLGAGCAHGRATFPPPPAPPANTFIDPGIRQIEYRQDGSVEISGPQPTLDPGLLPLAPGEPGGSDLEEQRARHQRFQQLFPD